MMSKPKLVYYSATPDDGDSVAAYLRTSTDALTSTDVGGKKSLDVNVANAITVAMDGIYDDPDNLLPDSAGAIFHVRGATVDITSQTLRVTGAAPSSDNVDPANSIALDVNSFLMGYDGSAWDRITATGGALDVNLASTEVSLTVVGNVADDSADSGNPVKVGSRALGAALSAISAANDRADMVSDLYRRILVNNSPNIACSQTLVATNASTATQLDSGIVLAGRKTITLQNTGTKAVFVGSSTVTASGATTGIKIPAQGELTLDWGQYVPVYAIAESGTPSVMIFQIG